MLRLPDFNSVLAHPVIETMLPVWEMWFFTIGLSSAVMCLILSLCTFYRPYRRSSVPIHR